MSCFKIFSIISFLIGISSILVGVFYVRNRQIDVLVTIENGVLQGQNRGYYYAFEGVPYAEPPIGDLRFEPPRKLMMKWDGVRDAGKVGDSCMQWDHLIFSTTDRVKGKEDCLFLNIYTPDFSGLEKYPVVFYIHGGAFMYGSGDLYGPLYLLDRKVILVNINYRLGPLGFLSTEDNIVPGNMGLKDQSFALRWVKENIEKFGGDPNKITITGYSAGGASVHLHYMSKLSEGLFQNGISHSGCALNPWVFTEEPLARAKFVANHLGCSTVDTTTLVKCLKTKPAHQVVATMKFFQPFLYNPFSPFGAVIEPPSPTAFISESPRTIIETGRTQNVPWLASMTLDEGVYGAGEFAMNDNYLLDLNKNWNKIAPHVLDFNWTVPLADHKHASKQIRRFYLNSLPISRESLPMVVKILTDRLYGVGLQTSVKLQTNVGVTPTHFYHFKFNTVYGVEHLFVDDPKFDLGVSHGDDVLLIYEAEFRKKVPFTRDELEMQRMLVDLTYNFAKTGTLKFGTKSIEKTTLKPDTTYTYFEINSPTVYQMTETDDLANEIFWNIIPPN